MDCGPFIAQRVAELDAIVERRNALLRQVFYMIRRRNVVSPIIGLEQVDGEKDLANFLSRFSMNFSQPQTGSITALCEEELYASLSVKDAVPDDCSVSKFSSSSTLDRELPVPVNISSPLPLSQASDDDRDELDLLRDGLMRAKQPIPRSISASQNLFTEDLSGHTSHESSLPIFPLKDHPITHTMKSQVGRTVTADCSRNASDSAVLFNPGAFPRLAKEFSGVSTEDQKSLKEFEFPRICSSSEDPKSHSLDELDSPSKSSEYPLVAATPKKSIISVSKVASPAAHEFQFGPYVASGPDAASIESDALPQHQFEPQYQMPPSKYLKTDAHKKTKASKRKRDRDRERHDSRKDGDWAPQGIHRWIATINANPVWKKVSRATKCLSTREWAIAMTELRLVRTMDRIELLKREGRWSFRQPKKQRNIGGSNKVHWDYLIDEMRWMRTDFREERKWKIAVAYTLSTAVLEWHAAGRKDVRIATGICGNSFSSIEVRKDNIDSLLDPVSCLHILQRGGDVEPDDGGDRCKRTTLLGIDLPELSASAQQTEGSNVKIEEPQVIGSPHVHHNKDTPQLALNDGMKSEDKDWAGECLKEYESNVSNQVGLKEASNDPILGCKLTPSSSGGDMERIVPLKSSNHNSFLPLRQMIAYSSVTQLFLDLDDFIDDNVDNYDVHPPSDLVDLFPEYAIFGMLDIGPGAQCQPAGAKNKSEKRNDRDDSYKRIDEANHTKLYPSGDFMFFKSTLLGPLQPSKYWKDGQWLPTEDCLSASDVDHFSSIPDDNMNELFDSRSCNAPSVMATQLQVAFLRDRDNRRRVSNHHWTATDDNLLKTYIDKFPYNWALIAEYFNSSRLTTSTDIRTPRDCLERWKDRWARDFRRPTDNITGDDPAANSQVTTRGVKRITPSTPSSQEAGGTNASSESKKRRRHLLIQESIRKAMKKRSEMLQKQQAAQRKPPAIHETHAQYNKMPYHTPQDLSRMKTEKEVRDLQGQLARKQREEMNRATFPRDQTQRLSTNVSVVQTQPQQPAASSVQRVPVIRSQVNISQQQRLSASSISSSNQVLPHVLPVPVRGVAQQPGTQQVQGSNQGQGNNVSLNGNVPTNDATLSASYTSREAALVQVTNATTVAINSSQSPQVQTNTPLPQGNNSGTRSGYYLPSYTSEQLHTAVRIQQQQQSPPS